MANISGSQFDDHIHRAGDGTSGPANEIDDATTGADTIAAGAGHDAVFADGGDDVVTGFTGNDLLVGAGGNDNISGGDGNDIIRGEQGVDVLTGGAGYDIFRIEQISDIDGLAESIDGGADIDRLDFQNFNAFGSVNLSLATLTSVEEIALAPNSAVTMTSTQLGGFTGVFGSFATDRILLSTAGTVDLTGATINSIEEIRGTAGANVVILTDVAEGQRVNGLGGEDRLTGGHGGDVLDGGDADDRLTGANGHDSLIGDAGIDILSGGAGGDTLRGGQDADSQLGGIGNDVFTIEQVSDIGGLAETVDGGLDVDRLDFQLFDARGGVDLTLATLTGVEQLALQGNDATLTAAQLGAFQALLGSFLVDRVILAAAGTADLTGATIASIEEIRGSTGNDVINLTDVATGQTVNGVAGNDIVFGSVAADVIDGGIGDDILRGDDGFDRVIGGQGADALQGGVGNDVFSILQVSDISGLAESVNGGNDVDRLDFQQLGAVGAVDLSLATLASVEQLSLSNNTVTLTAAQLGAFTGLLGSFAIERLILSAAGTADLTGATIDSIEEIRGTAGNDTVILAGVTTVQTVNGLDGADTLIAGESFDAVDGGTGNDTLSGRAGNDVLSGDLGKDLLTGGAGVDTFDYDLVEDSVPTADRDTIQDFTHGEDRIDLAGIDANTEVAGDQAFVFLGAGLFTGVAGQLRYNGSVVQADVNGDGLADFNIQLVAAPVVTGADFVL
jgi:Ca2+-binding RTX toxin-like protein